MDTFQKRHIPKIPFSEKKVPLVIYSLFLFLSNFWNPRAGHLSKANINSSWGAWLVLTTILILQIFYLVKRSSLCQTFGNGYNTGSCKETFCDCSTIFWVNLPLSIYVLRRTYIWFHLIENFQKPIHSEIVHLNKSFFKRKIQRWKSSLILLLTINKLHRVLKIVLVTPPRAMHLKYFRAFDT